MTELTRVLRELLHALGVDDADSIGIGPRHAPSPDGGDHHGHPHPDELAHG